MSLSVSPLSWKGPIVVSAQTPVLQWQATPVRFDIPMAAA